MWILISYVRYLPLHTGVDQLSIDYSGMCDNVFGACKTVDVGTVSLLP